MSTELMSRFLENLHASRLLDNDRIDELLRRPEPPQGDMDGVARFLEGNGWLTRFQVDEIREGRGAALTFSGYRLLEKLPDRPSGSAYRAFHPALQKAVVLRWIEREWLGPAEQADTYLQRAQSASLLNHPHLVNVLDAGLADDRIFVVEEWVDGADLDSLVREMGALPVMLASEYTRQAALGLKAGLERGLSHGDLSPQCLILAPVVRRPGDNGDGKMVTRPAPGATIKVANLGMTPIRPPLKSAVFGSIAFAAPERLDQSARDARADLWSLGASLFFLLSARPPVAGASPTEQMQQLQDGTPPRIDRLRNDVPAPLADFVHRMLNREPAQRPASLDEVIQFLTPYCQLSAPPPLPMPIAAAVPLASETGTIPTAKPVADELPMAEPLPHVEPLPAGTSDSQVYSPRNRLPESSHLSEEDHHDQFAHDHGYDPRPARKEPKAKANPTWIILAILLHVIPITVAILYFTGAFESPASSSTTVEEKPSDSDKNPKKLKGGSRL